MNRIEKTQRVFGYTLLLGNKLQLFGDSVMEEFSLKQWFLLIMINEMPMDSPSVNQISKFMGTTRQNIRKMLVILEKKGYIDMQPSEKDARAFCVTLTDKAKNYIDTHEKWNEELLELLFQGISERELEVFMKVSEKLFQNLEEVSSDE